MKRSLWSALPGKSPAAAPASRPRQSKPLAMPLLLAGTSAKEGAVVARSGEQPGQAHVQPAGRREVVCFDCRATSKASARATSTQCSNCGAFIDLRDVEIRERSTQRIRTRGNVTIHKKGALLGTAVHCGSLIVEGSVAGSIYAQETVEFRADARILGEIRCRHLVVDRRITVSGLQPVHVESMTLAGSLAARVFCKGTVHIQRHGRFEGGLQAPWVKMDLGGGLIGPMMIGARRAATEEGPA